MAICSKDELKELDLREQGYYRERIPISSLSCAESIPVTDTFIYCSERSCYREGSPDFPVWFSYLDCVLFRFLEVYGERGVERFINSTTGLHSPVLDDRKCPIYPPAHQMFQDERDSIESIIDRIGVVKILPKQGEAQMSSTRKLKGGSNSDVIFDVAIVGGGIAGLYCAQKFVEKF